MNNYSEIFQSIDFEKIIKHPNILIAASFWDEDRFNAAKVCYKFMRSVDDMVDDYKSEHAHATQSELTDLEKNVRLWINTVLENGGDETEYAEIVHTMKKFLIPTWPLENFARSMIYDIYHDGFPTLDAFIEYSQGASIAPASIFVHLCGLTKNAEGGYVAPSFDVKEASTPCAIFSYLVHIIRDFVQDHTHNLNYFPLDLMEKYELTRENLLQMAKGEIEISSGFRGMIRELYDVASEYRLKTIEVKNHLQSILEPGSQLSLEVVFSLYDMVFDRIDVDRGTFTTEELNPTAEEIKERVRQIVYV